MKPPFTRSSRYTFNSPSLKTEILKSLHSRRMLIFICSLVVLECICVMAELMVDLHGIRVRFENEEKQIQKFLTFMRSKQPELYEQLDGHSLGEVLYILQKAANLWDLSRKQECLCSNTDTQKSERTSFSKHTRLKRRDNLFEKRRILKHVENSNRADNTNKSTSKQSQIWSSKLMQESYSVNENITESKPMRDSYQNGSNLITRHEKQNRNIPKSDRTGIQNTERTTRSARGRRSSEINGRSVPDVFIFSVNADIENYYLVTEFSPLSTTNLSHTVQMNIEQFQNEYEKYHEVSDILTFVGFSIFGLMLLEILVKFACHGLNFFKKKIEVFDAVIVAVSFALDASFLDSKWYETGKGATTVLVLLLPWRVVRIVNSFLMTINHKHHIEIMTIKRAKKKCEIKLFKLKELVLELRRDVDLLVNLSKLKGASSQEISACIYGKGRCTATLAAITSFTSLMFISTLGKRDPREDYVNDDLYGNIIRDILDDDENDDVTHHNTHPADLLDEKDDDDEEVDVEQGEVYTVSRCGRRSEIKRKTESRFASKRRATIPRRHVSCGDGDFDDGATCSYVNDGYVNCDEIKHELGSGCKAKSIVKSLPSLKRQTSSENGMNNLLTFEVRTEVSYL